MYLNSKLDTPEYMKIKIDLITPDIIDEYNVIYYVYGDGYTHFEITGAVYGLKVSGYKANQDLIKHLKRYGYYPSRRTPGFWHHKTRDIQFASVVDDFGLKYTKKEDEIHLGDALKNKYPITESKFIGMNINWHYDEGCVTTQMENYNNKAINEFEHPILKRIVHGPTMYTPPEYGEKVQYAPAEQI